MEFTTSTSPAFSNKNSYYLFSVDMRVTDFNFWTSVSDNPRWDFLSQHCQHFLTKLPINWSLMILYCIGPQLQTNHMFTWNLLLLRNITSIFLQNIPFTIHYYTFIIKYFIFELLIPVFWAPIPKMQCCLHEMLSSYSLFYAFLYLDTYY